MHWTSLKLVPLAVVVALAACSDDGLVGEDDMTGTAGDTDGADTSPVTGAGDSSGGDPTDTGNDTADPGSTGGEATTGADTTGGTGDGSTCVARCVEDADCLNGGADVGLSCSEQGFCHAACEEAADCIPIFSGWIAQPCSTNDECLAGPCVDYGGEMGGCATEPTKALDCAGLSLDEIETTDIDGNAVTVCGAAGGQCQADMLGDMSCTLETCETLGCADPLVCGDDGHCQCTQDSDCVDAGTGDTCTANGYCAFGCDDVAQCEEVFGEAPLDGQTLSCE